MLILPQTTCVVDTVSTMDLKTLPKTFDSGLAESAENTTMSVDAIKTNSPLHEQHQIPHQHEIQTLSPPLHNLSSTLHHQQPQQQTSPTQLELPPLQQQQQQHHHQQQEQQQRQKHHHHHHPKEFRQHQQQLRQPHHNWDINDSSLPVPDRYDPFDLWPVGHCRRVYRGDIDDARRHISGWAMRNTNNHNALILKKSCLGVLVCSSDCMLDNGRKVHFRPAICDKARRKQIGKPCPNPGCCGKLTLLPCRGHCGYPVTHFWRQVKGSVFFQAKGYHDHPRPDVKSLSEKGRNALAKHIRHSLAPFVSHTGKRRIASLADDHVPVKKKSLKEKEVMCSCPPFECTCNLLQHQSQKTRRGLTHPPPNAPNANPFNTTVVQSALFPLPPQEPYPVPGPVTQINITNTCLPTHHTNLGVNIPYTPNNFLPPNTRIYHPNTAGLPEEQQHAHHVNFMKFGETDAPPPPHPPPHSSPGAITSHPPPFHHNFDEFKSRLPHIPYPDFQQHHGTQDPLAFDHPPHHHSTPFPMNPNDHQFDSGVSSFDRIHNQRTPPNHLFIHQRDAAPEMHSPPGAEHNGKIEPHFQPNFLIPYDVPAYDSQSPVVENRSHEDISAHQNPAFLPDFNALSFCPSSPTDRGRECVDSRDDTRRHDPYVPSSHSRNNNSDNNHNLMLQPELRNHEQNQENMTVNQPTFITLTSPEKQLNSYDHVSCRQSNVSPQATSCTVENPTCHPTTTHTHTAQNYNPSIRSGSTTPTHPVHNNNNNNNNNNLSSPVSSLMQLGCSTSNYEAFAPMSNHNLTSCGNSEASHIPEAMVSNTAPSSNALTPPPSSHRELSTIPGQQQQQQHHHHHQQQQQQQQHAVPSEGSALPPYQHGTSSYPNTSSTPTFGFNPYRTGDVYQPTPNQHLQQYNPHSQSHAHQHQYQHSQRKNSINITLTYN